MARLSLLLGCLLMLKGLALAQSPVPEDTLISLERSRCYGTCPAYSVSVDANGQVKYSGEHYVRVSGEKTDRVSTQVVRALLEAFEKVDFLSFPENVDKLCEARAADAPSSIVHLTTGGQSKTVTHDYGCAGNEYFERLAPIEEEIDRALGTKRWVGDRSAFHW